MNGGGALIVALLTGILIVLFVILDELKNGTKGEKKLPQKGLTTSQDESGVAE